jgi:anti-anti-sigma regulatory factor
MSKLGFHAFMPNTITLAARMNFQASKDLHSRLNEYSSQDVEIDASSVDFLGGLAVQTLIAASRHWRASGCAFAITGASAPFRQCLTELGLLTYLPIDGDA